MKLRPLLLALVSSLAGAVHADVKLPALFSDHAVLQRDATVPVWGWAAKGEEVTVSIAGQSQTTQAGDNGKWRVDLKNLSAGGLRLVSCGAGGQGLLPCEGLGGEGLHYVWMLGG